MIKPLQFAVYKGTSGKFGAAQFNLQLPHWYRGKEKDFTGERALDSTGKPLDDWKQREGAVFVEVTSATGPNQYAWDRKITMALSVSDMGKILAFFATQRKLDIMHDPGAKSDSAGAVKKYLSMDAPNGILGTADTKGGCMLRLSMDSSGEKISHMVPMSTDEVLALKRLIEQAIPVALAWQV